MELKQDSVFKLSQQLDSVLSKPPNRQLDSTLFKPPNQLDSTLSKPTNQQLDSTLSKPLNQLDLVLSKAQVLILMLSIQEEELEQPLLLPIPYLPKQINHHLQISTVLKQPNQFQRKKSNSKEAILLIFQI